MIGSFVYYFKVFVFRKILCVTIFWWWIMTCRNDCLCFWSLKSVLLSLSLFAYVPIITTCVIVGWPLKNCSNQQSFVTTFIWIELNWILYRCMLIPFGCPKMLQLRRQLSSSTVFPLFFFAIVFLNSSCYNSLAAKHSDFAFFLSK